MSAMKNVPLGEPACVGGRELLDLHVRRARRQRDDAQPANHAAVSAAESEDGQTSIVAVSPMTIRRMAITRRASAVVVVVAASGVVRVTLTRYAVTSQVPFGPGANVSSFTRLIVSGPASVTPETSTLNVAARNTSAPAPSASASIRTGVAVTVGVALTGVMPSSVSTARSAPVAFARDGRVEQRVVTLADRSGEERCGHRGVDVLLRGGEDRSLRRVVERGLRTGARDGDVTERQRDARGDFGRSGG